MKTTVHMLQTTTLSIHHKTFLGITDIPSVTIPKVPHLYDINNIKSSSCNYFCWSNTEPSSSDTGTYFDCIDELAYISPEFNCEGETRYLQSIGTIDTKDHKHSPPTNDPQNYFLAATSIFFFSDPSKERHYFSASLLIESIDSKCDSLHECV